MCLSENEYYELNGDLMNHWNAFHVFDCIVTVLQIFLVLHTVCILDAAANFIQDVLSPVMKTVWETPRNVFTLWSGPHNASDCM